MSLFLSSKLLLVCVFVAIRPSFSECTTLLFGRETTTHGFPAVTHANDCAECDNRMAFVAGRKARPNSMRPVYDGAQMSFPRLSDATRSSIYANSSTGVNKEAQGFIPESEETYSLYEASYPLVNEFGVAFGESTTILKQNFPNTTFVNSKDSEFSAAVQKPLFAVAALMAVALERCKSARCAVETMGSLATEFGFYGESPGTGEAVTVIDKQEAWLFEIAPSPRGALWVGERIPDDHVLVVANSLVIDAVACDDEEKFICAPRLIERIQELGLYDGKSRFSWKRTLGGDTFPLYAKLRLWRIYSQVAREKEIFRKLPDEDGSEQYPVSVQSDRKFSIDEIFNLHRDHYEGTPFDMTQGVMAGPFGNPNYELGLELREVPGQIPRAISIMRTSYTEVSTSGPIPKVWFAPDAPATSVFVPFFPAAAQYSTRYGNAQGPSLRKFERHSAFWAFDFVANWMSLNYRNMSAEMVYPARDALQRWVLDQTEELERQASNGDSLAERVALLGTGQAAIQEAVVEKWWNLADELIVRYNDGFFNFGTYRPDDVGGLPIPTAWLRMIGFDFSFTRPGDHWVRPLAGGKITPAVAARTEVDSNAAGILTSALLVLLPLLFYVGTLLGAKLERARKRSAELERAYVSL